MILLNRWTRSGQRPPASSPYCNYILILRIKLWLKRISATWGIKLMYLYTWTTLAPSAYYTEVEHYHYTNLPLHQICMKYTRFVFHLEGYACCPTYSWLDFRGNCYLNIGYDFKYEEAVNSCNDTFGAQLVSITSQIEDDFLQVNM